QASMQYGSGGAGSASHLACVLLNAAVGINVTHVPYRGAAPAMQDLIAGRIDYPGPDTPIAIPQVQSKVGKAIARVTRYRSAALPGGGPARTRPGAGKGVTKFRRPEVLPLLPPKGNPRGAQQKASPRPPHHKYPPRRKDADAGDRRRSRRGRAELT